MPPRKPNAAIKALITERVAIAMAAYETSRTNGGGEGSDAVEGQRAVNQGCSYKEFMHCKPLNFSGNEGTAGLARWFEKLESIFHNRGCTDDNRVKYATCTLRNDALTWWSMYTRSVGVDAACETTWEEFRQMMIEEYCPRNEIRKLETELVNLKMKGTDVVSYTRRFQELALLCPTMVTSEHERIRMYVQGLSPKIQEDVTSFDPKTIQAAICMAHKLMDQIVLQETTTEDTNRKQDENKGKNAMQYTSKKRKMDETCDAVQKVKRGYAEKLPYCGSCDKHHTGYCTMICNQCKIIGHMARDCRNPAQIAKVITVKNVEEGCAEGKGYLGNHPYCNRCGRHHPGRCTVVCKKCKKVGHMIKDCRVATPMPITAIPLACFKCEEVGHFKKNCPRLKEQTLKQPKEELI